MKQLSISKVHAFIDSVASLVDEAQQRNFVRWPILNTYVWPNAYIGGTYANEVKYLKNWIVQRLAWMDTKLTGGPVSVPEGTEKLPGSFKLGQNFPNPFNPSTTIEYHIPQAGHISLTVHDVLGKQVAVLVNTQQDAGVHRVLFNSSKFNLSSGIYFYQLRASSHSALQKMAIIK